MVMCIELPMKPSTDAFSQSKRILAQIIVLLAVLLALFVFAALFGPGFEPGSSDLYWGIGIGVSLFAIVCTFGWLYWRNPKVLVVSEDGIDIPMTFKRPLRWDEIHRVRRVQVRGSFFSRRDWLIIDPSPGVLAPLRLPVWRRLELALQSRQGVRIPLHGLEEDPERVVQSIERYRPVILENS